MCGIVGYVGKKLSRDSVVNGLSRLEYRGYDSAGFACINPADGRLVCVKATGHLADLKVKLQKEPIDGYAGIGHIRWSSHGVVSQENAHPQFDCSHAVSVVHNGIIENEHSLRAHLFNRGHTLASQTDTELIAHLLEEELQQKKPLKEAIVSLVAQLEGAYAIAILLQAYPDHLIIIRKGSPLCIGFKGDEIFVASDQIAFAGKADMVSFLPDATFGIVTSSTVKFYNFLGITSSLEFQPMDTEILQWLSNGKGGFEHFMLKEIYEQKGALHHCLRYYTDRSLEIWKQLGLTIEQARKLKKVFLVGAGTSWHAASVAQFFFEKVAKIQSHVFLASEFRHTSFFADPEALYIAVSQSGETADTLEALRLMNSYNVATVALTNVSSSTAVREAKGFLLTYSGQEVAVASTKTFTSQVVVLFWLAHRLAKEKGYLIESELCEAESDAFYAAEVLENSIELYRTHIIKNLAPRYAHYDKFIFIGRHMSYPFALEAALKLKEISYIFAQCYPAGELKHGSLALIDETVPVVVFSSLDPLIYQKLLSNVQEIKARHGHLIIFAFEEQEALIKLADTCFIIKPVNELLSAVAMVGLMQFFIYQIAKELKRPIDKPRNLAKTLTIE